MLLVSCAQNKGGLLMSSETSTDECRAAQTSFLNTFCSSPGQECSTTLNKFNRCFLSIPYLRQPDSFVGEQKVKEIP